MEKTTKIVIFFIIILVVVVSITLFLNREDTDERKEMLSSAEVKLLVSGEEVATLSMEDIQAAEVEEFEAVYDTSKTEPVMLNYTGVQLKYIMEQQGVDFNEKETVILSAVDGYTVAYSMEEVLMDKNVYLTYAEEGELLKSKEEGGSGPYQTIVVSDTFSSRRCKWLTTIEVR